ncbi:phage tail protein [Acinetobacter gerneri]|uniref:Phage tail protein n=1 Tax=Acinetobacter gerneri TaxID=202952 RepID=A0AAW8JEH0_9GAMM|nr:phage tail protein [Acinetobacter gerneri]MDQ9009041.1 phage tail protein [Acinetobacter gerneri]MDQ9013145.1 phage tail protein [Acinetobacter gerneri]MDQ9024582.1 phage tail protein [Acinetobacter gerneri]MDQ9051817.1 phage tail protein [Acinetobacter gerneri]MDQ9059202.1 phage tail protein [Acinetobacter gerneri]
MANNRVEVHVGAKTSELKTGMKESEKIVDDGIKKIEQAGNGVKLKIDTSELTSSVNKATDQVQKKLKDSTEGISKTFSEKFKEGFKGSELGSSIDGVTSKLGGLRGGAILAAGALAGLVIGGLIGATVGLSNLAIETAKNNVELAKFSALANSSIQDFQGLSGAAQTLGISQEKTADMMKDFNEKIGEFASVGSGGAKDFFEQIAVKTENGAAGAKKLAEEMSKMDGVTALQTYVDKLEEAGVNQQQMSFYLESMGSDLTTLAPILADGGKLWKEYQEAMEEAGIITGDAAIERSIELKAQTETLQMQYQQLKSELAQAVMPVMSSLISHFMNGSNVGNSFAGVIQLVGNVAKGVAISITVLATGIQNLVRLISGALSSLQAIGATAVNFANADGFLAKGRALVGGFKAVGSEVKSTVVDMVNTTKQGIATASDIWNGKNASFDKLTQANINNQKANLDWTKNQRPGVTSGIGQNKALNPTAKSHKEKTPKHGKSDAERQAEQEAKAIAAIRYKYATEEEKIQLDLQKALDEISKSKLSEAEKADLRVKAEKVASDKIKALHAEQFEKIKEIREEEIANALQQAQRIYDIEKANLQAQLDAKKITNEQKVLLEKRLEDQLRAIKRNGLEERLKLEEQYSSISGKKGDQNSISNDISDLDTDQKVSDTKSMNLISEAQMKDFEDKFGGLTDRISGLWDKGIQSMMNGTLTWKNAMNAIFTELAGAFIQSMITAPMKKYAASLATRLAVKLGLIKTETAAEVAGQAAQTGVTIAGEATRTSVTAAGGLARLGLKAAEAIKGIMMSAWEAMAGAFKAMVAIPYVGPILAVGAGAAAFGLVAGLAGKIKSARGGYDIPAGVNPMTQLHEEEMVLPKQHANTIRALGKNLTSDGGIGGGGGSSAQTFNNFTIQAWDSKDVRRFMEKHGRELAGGLKGYNRNFGR